jgi:hypothetical protein
VDELNQEVKNVQASIAAERDDMRKEVATAQRTIVETRATALLQEVGIYDYRHPHTRRLLTDFKTIKSAVRKDGGAVLAATNWTVNGSTTEGGKMVREISKLMLRTFKPLAGHDNV